MRSIPATAPPHSCCSASADQCDPLRRRPQVDLSWMDRTAAGQEGRRPPSDPGGSVSQPAPRPLALVTGASSGIGRELAKQFVEHGFDLIIAAENVELDDATQELRALGAAVAPVS